jgi:transposase InsO family protein
MAYNTNPQLPKLRARAVNLVRQGQSIRQVAKYFGFNPSTISRWNKKFPLGVGTCLAIPTQSSKPRSCPWQLPPEVKEKIVQWRIKTKGRCAEVLQRHLANEGIRVSLNSVKRTLRQAGLIRPRSPWKRLHLSEQRPLALKPGDLVQLDTIHLRQGSQRIYLYTLLDVYSRWAYAKAFNKINTYQSLNFLKQARKQSNFTFNYLQSDHGPEFSQHFTERAKISHRHSRVRRPNDNAHLERFNLTIQQEFLNYLPKDVKMINSKLAAYLQYYNQERLHLGLGLKTPQEILSRCCEGPG